MPHPLWTELAAAANRTLSDTQFQQLDRYLDLLAEANQRMNLTRIIDREQAAVGHVGDALTLLPHLPTDPFRIADVGSGGGVPGMPLAIALPNAQMILVESTQKKAEFLRQCAAELGLKNVRVLPQRVEDVGRSDLRETCNIVTARAVGELVFLVEWCIPLLSKGGRLLAMKGAKAAEEIGHCDKVLKALNASQPVVHQVALPGADNHVIVQITKLGRTDPRYPRPATVAKNRAIR